MEIWKEDTKVVSLKYQLIISACIE